MPSAYWCVVWSSKTGRKNTNSQKQNITHATCTQPITTHSHTHVCTTLNCINLLRAITYCQLYGCTISCTPIVSCTAVVHPNKQKEKEIVCLRSIWAYRSVVDLPPRRETFGRASETNTKRGTCHQRVGSHKRKMNAERCK